MRTCAKCPTSRMADDARHLHELKPETRFRLQGRTAVFVLAYLSLGRATVNAARPADRGLRSFTTADGRRVEFREGPVSSRRPCSPFATVIPFGGGGVS